MVTKKNKHLLDTRGAEGVGTTPLTSTNQKLDSREIAERGATLCKMPTGNETYCFTVIQSIRFAGTCTG